MKKIKNKEFISRAKKIHGNKYDYSKVEYINSYTNVCIICPKHGEFWQTPHTHLKGYGCKLCGGYKMTTDIFIEKSRKIHGDRYDYSKVEYINNHTKVCIICPEHGEFWQTPNNHLNGHGCPKCSREKFSLKKTLTNNEFIHRAKLINGNKYDYSKTLYKGIFEKVCIICPKHGEFWQKANDHINLNTGCPVCGNVKSSNEIEISKILSEFKLINRDRSILNGKEIDIYIPSLKLGIEYNGLRWHSEEFEKDRNYHLNKTNECETKGIRLIQIFEDEWINHREICESKLKQICGLNTNQKIYARKCEIHEIINKNEAYEFLDNNHIQGRTGFTVGLGAYYNGELIGVMTLKKEREGYWDLNRFATEIHHQCIGVGGKLFKWFVKHYNYQEIKSFADRRWTTNPNDNLYTKLGFAFDSYVPPTYWYFNTKASKHERLHKFGFRKQSLHRKYGLSLDMSEQQMTKELGYTRIWDCGLIKYIYNNKT